MHMTNKEIGAAMTIKLDPVLPEYPVFKEGIRRFLSAAGGRKGHS